MMRFDRWLAFGLSLFAAGTAWAQGKVEVHWLGQAATEITTPGGKVIMIDPFLTKNPKTPPLKGTPQEYTQALDQASTRVFPINPGDKLEF